MVSAPRRPQTGSRRGWLTIAAIGVGIIVALAAGLYGSGILKVGTGPPSPIKFLVNDLTGLLGPTFHPGAIQGFGSNTSTVQFTGIGEYDKPTDFSLPVLAQIQAGGSGPIGTNKTPVIEQYFRNGGTYGAAWNGTAWLLTGEATWGTRNVGTGIFMSGTSLTNLTPKIERYFPGEGVWIAAWNGTSWLIGGNSTSGAVLVSITGSVFTNLSGVLPTHSSNDWIQLLAWNGTSWLVGGHGIFGTLENGRYTNLLPQSPFVGNGVFAADWNGANWLVGGGAPASIVRLSGTSLIPAAPLPSDFRAWVSAIVAFSGGWLLVGQGTVNASVDTPAMAYWSGSTGTMTDLTTLLPGSFQGGQPAFAGKSPLFGPSAILIAGWGGYNTVTGLSTGAVAEVIPSGG
jgi:hypothetical protein